MHVDLDTYTFASIVLRWEMQSVWLKCTFYSEDGGRESIDIDEIGTCFCWRLLPLSVMNSWCTQRAGDCCLVYRELLVCGLCWRLLSLSIMNSRCLHCAELLVCAVCWIVLSIMNSWCVQCAGDCAEEGREVQAPGSQHSGIVASGKLRSR